MITINHIKSLVAFVVMFIWMFLITSCEIKQRNSNQHLYIITSHQFQSEQTYVTDSIISKQDNCITFKYLMGEQTICGNYSLAKY